MSSVLCDDPYKAALFLDTEKVNSSLGPSFDNLHLKYYYCENFVLCPIISKKKIHELENLAHINSQSIIHVLSIVDF